MKDASTRTALACLLLGIFYPKDELKGRRLHELDQGVIQAITGICLYYSVAIFLNLNTLNIVILHVNQD